MLNHLGKRFEKGQETPRTLFLRPFLYSNKWRHKQVKVTEENWDFLLVLDACRYDTFKEINTISGKLEKKYSLGTHTVEWLKNNFNQKLDDIVYISGNPQASSYKFRQWTNFDNPFYHLENVWDWGWDEKLKTVHPRTVNKSAIELIGKYPEKKFIIHYLQPHHPFIGKGKLKFDSEDNKILNSPSWKAILRKKFSLEDIKKSYRNNLKLVLEHVTDLVKKLNGKTVITSDHGELFGEFGLYGHIPLLYCKYLIEIPWLVNKND